MTATTEEYRKIENWMKESLELVELPLEYQYGDYDDLMFKAVTKKDHENLTLRFKNSLIIINRTQVGKTLLELIRINTRIRGKVKTETFTKKTASVGPVIGCEFMKHSFNGVGQSPILYINLEVHNEKVSYARDYKDFFNKMSIEDADSCILFHELTHVYHQLIGQSIKIQVPSFAKEYFHPNTYEEARTTGLGQFRTEEISENSYREERNLQRRTRYTHLYSIINDDDTLTLINNKNITFPMFPEGGRWRGH